MSAYESHMKMARLHAQSGSLRQALSALKAAQVHFMINNFISQVSHNILGNRRHRESQTKNTENGRSSSGGRIKR